RIEGFLASTPEIARVRFCSAFQAVMRYRRFAAVRPDCPCSAESAHKRHTSFAGQDLISSAGQSEVLAARPRMSSGYPEQSERRPLGHGPALFLVAQDMDANTQRQHEWLPATPAKAASGSPIGSRPPCRGTRATRTSDRASLVYGAASRLRSRD